MRNARNGCAIDLTSGAHVTAWDLIVQDCYKGVCLASASECFLFGSRTSISVRNQVILADREAVLHIDGSKSSVPSSDRSTSNSREEVAASHPEDSIEASTPAAAPQAPPSFARLQGTQLAVVATRPVLVLGSSLAAVHRAVGPKKPIRGVINISNIVMTALETNSSEAIAALIAVSLEDSAACDLRLESIVIHAKANAVLDKRWIRRRLRTESPGVTKTDHTDWTAERVLQLLCLSNLRSSEDDNGPSGALLRNVHGIDHSTPSGSRKGDVILPIGLGISVRRCSQPIWLEGVKNITMLDIAESVTRVVCNETCTFTRASTGDVPATISLKHKSNLWIVDKAATETAAAIIEGGDNCTKQQARSSSTAEFLADRIIVEDDSTIIAVARSSPSTTTSRTAFSILASFAPACGIHIDESSYIGTMPLEEWTSEVCDEETRRSSRMSLLSCKHQGLQDDGGSSNGGPDKRSSNSRNGNDREAKRESTWASSMMAALRFWLTSPAGAAAGIVVVAVVATAIMFRK
jgi:hypothetical protein